MSFKRQVLLMLLFFILSKTFFYFTVVPSGSMIPTLMVNDYVVYYKTHNVEKGDVILFVMKEMSGLSTKRVIAVGGESVEVKSDGVYVDNIRAEDRWNQLPQGHTSKFMTLQHDELYVMGDNRQNSMDSRDFGPIEKDRVRGKYLFRIPFGRFFN